MAEHPPSNTQSSPLHNDDLPWSEEQDKAIKVALHAVPLPAGLEHRLVAAMSARAGTQEPNNWSRTIEAPGMQADHEQSLPDNLLVSSGALRGHFSNSVDLTQASDSLSVQDPSAAGGPVRRALLVMALAASLSGFALLASRWQLPAEKSWLISQSTAILQKIEHDNPADWRTEHQPVLALPSGVRAQLSRVAPIGQRRLADLGSKSNGMAYRLDRGDGVALYLLQMPSLPAVRGLTSRFEILPTPSGSWSLAALRLGDETFVLAAACTQQQMFNYINRPDVT